MMQRRYFMRMASACALGAALALAGTSAAQDAQAPVVAAPKIIGALSKDVVLDRSGQERSGQERPGQERPGQERSGQERRDPSISLQVQFTFDSADLLPQGRRQLDELAIALNDKALLVAGFELAGHTDRVGDADYNVKLSMARAEAVKAYLAQVHGVAPARLQTIGYGFSRLLDAANPGSPVNRRVEVRRLAMLLGAPPAAMHTGAGRLVPTPK